MSTSPIIERTEEQAEADARKITCKTCHAPVGVGCVSVQWKAEDGVFRPSIKERTYHVKRLGLYDKIIAKYGETR
jgi:hypothetical protein